MSLDTLSAAGGVAAPVSLAGEYLAPPVQGIATWARQTLTGGVRMGYAPVSDSFHAHPKVMALGRDQDALALWILALTWSTNQLTDGVIPPQVPSNLFDRLHHRTRYRWVTALIRVGLWDERPESDGGGWVIHDFLDWQRSRQEITEIRAVKRVAGSLGGKAKAAKQKATSLLESALPTPRLSSSLHVTTRTNPPIVPPSRSALLTPSSPGFDAFWDRYPRKVGKDAARKTWLTRHLDVKADTIVAALTRQLGYLNRDNGQYIPNPATWLNQGRWQDEPPTTNGHMAGFGKIDMSGFQAFLEGDR